MTPARSVLTLHREGAFNYLWAKQVVGVNLAQHCAKSLRGTYVEGITPAATDVRVELDPALAFYVCGVAKPYNWSRNFHLLAVPAPGETAEAEFSGLLARVSNARLVPISDEWIDPAHEKAGFKSYNTCRNWQAAWWLARNL